MSEFPMNKKTNKRKVLVCGASGFIGRNIVEKWSGREDMELYGTYFRTPPRGSILQNRKISLLKVDLTSREQVDELIQGMDVVIQAAAVTTGAKDTITRPYIHVTDNAVMNSIIFRACFENQVKHVVFFSCTTMYPSGDGPVKEEDFDYNVTDKYFGVGWTKVYLEKMCEFYSRIGTTKYTVIRHSNIYGPYDKFDLDRSHVLGATIAKVIHARDGRIVVWGDGSEARDLLCVSDLVDFVEIILASQQEPFELVNLGFGSSIPIKQLVEKVIEISGKNISIEYDRTKPTIDFKLTLDVGKARKKYGWRPSVPLEEGLRRTLSWYRENLLLSSTTQPARQGQQSVL